VILYQENWSVERKRLCYVKLKPFSPLEFPSFFNAKIISLQVNIVKRKLQSKLFLAQRLSKKNTWNTDVSWFEKCDTPKLCEPMLIFVIFSCPFLYNKTMLIP